MNFNSKKNSFQIRKNETKYFAFSSCRINKRINLIFFLNERMWRLLSCERSDEICEGIYIYIVGKGNLLCEGT